VVLNVNGREEILLLGAEGTRPASTATTRERRKALQALTSWIEKQSERTSTTAVSLMQARQSFITRKGGPRVSS